MGVKFKLTGFNEMFEKIQNARGDLDDVASKIVSESADIIHQDYQTAITSAGVSSSLANRMPAPDIEHNGDAYMAHVGYIKGPYVPDDISDGYKAVFLNYGTPRIAPRNFVADMKKTAAPKVRKKQKEIFSKALEELL